MTSKKQYGAITLTFTEVEKLAEYAQILKARNEMADSICIRYKHQSEDEHKDLKNCISIASVSDMAKGKKECFVDITDVAFREEL